MREILVFPRLLEPDAKRRRVLDPLPRWDARRVIEGERERLNREQVRAAQWAASRLHRVFTSCG